MRVMVVSATVADRAPEETIRVQGDDFDSGVLTGSLTKAKTKV